MSNFSLYIAFFFSSFWAVLISAPAKGQKPHLPVSKYGLEVVRGTEVYEKMVLMDPQNKLVDLKEIMEGAKFDITYAGINNFLKRKIYPTPDIFLRLPAAQALIQASEILKRKGFGLLLFDGYRPYSVTELFYEEVGDTTFVADPRKGSKHNRGMAIDLTMYDLNTGLPVLMPSAYDEASERAYHSYNEGNPEELKNRALLRSAMEDAGFEIFKYEWWHYDYKGWQNCMTYDLWHDEIRKANLKFKR